VVKDLLAENLIEPLGEGESSGGRPPDMIRFKAERGCILGVEISASGLSFLLTDLDGAEIDTHAFAFDKLKTTPEAVCGYIGDGLKMMLRRQRKTRDQLLLLVVGVPAITNVAEGIVLSISTLDQWRSVPLQSMLKKVVDCMVIIENDTNLAAQGERYRGAARNERDFVFISIGANVGSGIVLGGRIHHGSQWSAGEIAYLRLPYLSRRQPTIHEFGELETVLTTSGILKSWVEAAKAVPGKPAPRGRQKLDGVGVLDLAQAGDAVAGKIVQQRADMVSDIIINLSLILNPGLILLGGEVGSHPVLLGSVHEQLKGSEFAVTKIAAGALGNRAVLWGAVSVALEEIASVLLPLPAD
jgi:glucokinase